MAKPDPYAYRVVWSAEDREYVALCAEFPSLSWLAKTPEAALRGIRRLCADTVRDMLADGEEIPPPLSLAKYSGRFVLRVPPELHRRLVMEAAESSVSLNRLVGAKLTYR